MDVITQRGRPIAEETAIGRSFSNGGTLACNVVTGLNYGAVSISKGTLVFSMQ